jgi:protein-L-isoaspartate(D-aspartate) O-methyltransferase
VIPLRINLPSARLAIAALLTALLAVPSFAQPPFPKQRAALVQEIIATAAEYPGLPQDPHFVATVRAIGNVPREAFVPRAVRDKAYQDTPLRIGYDQTISDPYIVAIMTATVGVTAGTRVLEIGTGSGYQAAVLAWLGAIVHSIEIVEPLAISARKRLSRLGVKAVTIKAGDGFAGWAEFAPYDAIIVTAGASNIPHSLIAQLKVGGKLVMPIGAQGPVEQLVIVTKSSETQLTRCSLGPAMFVPLTGRGERPATLKGVYDRTIAPCFAGQKAVWP